MDVLGQVTEEQSVLHDEEPINLKKMERELIKKYRGKSAKRKNSGLQININKFDVFYNTMKPKTLNETQKVYENGYITPIE